MKRSNKVEVTTVMLTIGLSLGACSDGIDNRMADSNYSNQPTQTYNYAAEKKLRITCNKPEDFSLPECHDPNNKQYVQGGNAVAPNSGSTHHSSSFIFIPHSYWGPYYGGSSNGSYGPATNDSRSYTNARSSVTSPGLTGMYRASTVAPANTASVSRGGFGGTGRSFAASAAHGSSTSAGG